MYFINFLFVTIIINVVNSQNKPVLDYFKSDSLRKFRKGWDIHRKPLENAITLALKETVGYGGMNVYIRKVKETLASGYFHNDNEIRLILKDLTYDKTPHCVFPEVQFSLSSNVLKVQTTLSKMVVYADYALMRNKSAIIYDPQDQDPYKSSPFLFQEVQDIGRLAIDMEECFLSGFIIATLNGDSVNLGYENFKIMNCKYTIEIYTPGVNSPPVIAKYVPSRKGHGLSIAKLLMKPINNDLVPKLQAAMFSFINTSAMFDYDLEGFRRNQESIFQETSSYITGVIRALNFITIRKNHGAVDMADFHVQWDDGSVPVNASNSNGAGEQITLKNMVLTGLDTVYSAHCGGPFKLNSVAIGEEIRFSSLQVRGYIDVKSTWTDIYAFSAEISDMSVDLQLDVYPDFGKQTNSIKKNHFIRTIEVKGFRRMVFTVPTVVFGSAEAMVGGYLLNEVPKLVHDHLKATLPEALTPIIPNIKQMKRPPTNDVTDREEEKQSSSDVQTEDHSGSSVISSSEQQDGTEKPMRNVFIKSKKRFKSASNLRAKHRGGKRTVDNKIKK